MVEIERIGSVRNGFGESPVWDARTGSLFWVDITARTIFRLRPATGTIDSWRLSEDIGSIALCGEGELVAAMRSAIVAVDLGSGETRTLAQMPRSAPHLRFNDGKCDRGGRFWCGTIDDREFSPVGELFRLDGSRKLALRDEGFVLVNGIAWNTANDVMYVADSRREVVYAYAFDLAEGTICDRRIHISTQGIEGRVDGATVAADGTYWCALVRGWQIGQFDEKGVLMRTIRLPVKYPLMCTFGGPDMDILYVTTSASLVTPDEAAGQPLAGALFAVHGCGSTGVEEPRYVG